MADDLAAELDELIAKAETEVEAATAQLAALKAAKAKLKRGRADSRRRVRRVPAAPQLPEANERALIDVLRLRAGEMTIAEAAALAGMPQQTAEQVAKRLARKGEIELKKKVIRLPES